MRKTNITIIAASLVSLAACVPPEQQRQYGGGYRPTTFHELADKHEAEWRRTRTPAEQAMFARCRDRAEMAYAMNRPGSAAANISASDVMANCLMTEGRRMNAVSRGY